MILEALRCDSPQGTALVARLSDRFLDPDDSCRQQVSEIIKSVRERGDAALIDYTRRFDSPGFSPQQLKLGEEEVEEAHRLVDRQFLTDLELACRRIEQFHQREREQSWISYPDEGIITGRLVLPVESAGLYVPGGQGGSTPLVSSVLMNGIPALIAGVKRRVMCSPPDGAGKINPALIVAAKRVGIEEIYKCGSAWAIAALAWGSESIKPVDVIVGPGNKFVTEAKRQVSGRVKIDMIAGPSEVLIVADHSADPAFIAADLLAQAEHDPEAMAMAICLSDELAEKVNQELKRQLPQLNRQEIAHSSLKEKGVLLIAPDLDKAIEIANLIAAEHLELMIEDPFSRLSQIRHAGAIFLGHHCPESAGDYLAGPNHVLPTMGTARFSSALGVETFVKKSSLISYSAKALQADLPTIDRLARLEGLDGHARSATIRGIKGQE